MPVQAQGVDNGQPYYYVPLQYGDKLWCVLGCQGDASWIADGFYERDSAYNVAYDAMRSREDMRHLHRDWLDIGFWREEPDTDMSERIMHAQRFLNIYHVGVNRERALYRAQEAYNDAKKAGDPNAAQTFAEARARIDQEAKDRLAELRKEQEKWSS